MGVDFITCSKCQDTFPDCGPNDYCVIGHRLCPGCMPDVPHEWDVDEEDENRAEILARRTYDGELTCAECPVCQMGGTKEQRQEKELADLRARLGRGEAERDAARTAARLLEESASAEMRKAVTAEKQRDAAEAALAELVACKDLKEQWEAASKDARPDVELPFEVEQLFFDYKTRQPLAWAAARAVLDDRARGLQ